ncbi:hypothetical protein N0O92_12335 [Alkalihalobacillus sp. MEB130]|uniref:hypothetical protein n=1 Tax=Alkalihalobacillus sp. MEB130 TaxID=2976704 RepID=UPI0028DF6560|nr:hypothetical protein [Alkalihalobacillus sp. MEB130]MDT8861022.1 hypothetical protein [Alkalihalobacillus sp. MEB130]
MRNVIAVFVLVILLNPIQIYAQNDFVEVYDIEKDKIVKTIPASPSVLSEAEMYLEHIDDIYKKFRPMPRKGQLIRVPFDSSVQITNNWMNSSVNEVIFIIPKNDYPLLLVFNEEKDPYFFTFTLSMDHLLDKISDKNEQVETIGPFLPLQPAL